MIARTVIFDGDCGFCRRSTRIGKALDWFHRIDWRARLEPGLEKYFPQVSQNETQNRMVSVDRAGRARGGFYAVRDMLLQFPLTFLPAVLMYIPGAHFLGVPTYNWIAKNRHRMGGSCKV